MKKIFNLFKKRPVRKPAIMIDLETLGTKTTAPIISIGATLFHPDKLETVEELRASSFSMLVALPSNNKAGRVLEYDTILWWMRRSPEAIRETFFKEGPKEPLITVLLEFYQWAVDACGLDKESHVDVDVWANDPDFDCTIMRSSTEAVNLRYPFAFWRHRSCRTLFALSPVKVKREEFPELVYHNAVDDAIFQAIKVQRAISALKNGK